MANFEIEIKTLLGDKAGADTFLGKLQKTGELAEQGSHKQLNHYFTGMGLQKLASDLKPHLRTDKAAELVDLAEKAKDYSVRTRWADGKVLFVLKATVDDTTSSNGTARLEFECEMPMTIEELDKVILDSGFDYQAKWSRERQEYKYKGLNVSIDKNAGYGYLAEFEKVIGDKSQSEETKSYIREIMRDLGAAELPQDRLARMFDFYNKNWADYYGTDKTFNIE